MKTKGFERILERKPKEYEFMSDEEWLEYYVDVNICNSLNAKMATYEHYGATHTPGIFTDIYCRNTAWLLEHSQELIVLMKDRIEELEEEK